MFKAFGQFVSRAWVFWLAFWLALLGITWAFAPRWSDVASQGDLQHLPDDMPSRVGARFYDEAFPSDEAESSIVVILWRDHEPLSLPDWEFMANQVVPSLQSVARQHGGVLNPSLWRELRENAGIAVDFGMGEAPDEAPENRLPPSPAKPRKPDRQGAETSPGAEAAPRFVSIDAPHNSALAPALVSEDGQAMLVYAQLTSNFINSRNMPLIEEVEQQLNDLRKSEQLPEGLQIDLTGSAVVGRDVIAAVNQSTQAIEHWTIWIVIAFLLLVFRAPLVSMIPLASVFCAIQISLYFLALLASLGWLELFDGLQVYLTVLLYGVGVDFALFLTARYQEELERGAKVRRAMVTTMDNVGLVILVSAGTQIAGIAMLIWASFGKFEQAGYTIPIGLAITMLAALTLTFAMLRVAGRWGFWPLKLSSEEARDNDQERHPLRREEWAQKIWYRIGQWQERRALTIWLVTLLLVSPLAAVAVWNWGEVTYDMTRGLPEDSPSLAGNNILQERFSTGIISPLTLVLHNPNVDFRSREGLRWMERFGENLQALEGPHQVADVRSAADPLGTSPRVRKRIGKLAELLPMELRLSPQGREIVSPTAEPPDEMGTVLESLIADAVFEHYVSDADATAGQVTRVTLVLNADPLHQESITAIDQWRQIVHDALPSELRSETQIHLLGPTATLADVRQVANDDRSTIFISVTVAVLVVLVLLLRQVAMPVYLVAMTFFSYLLTLGATRLITMWLEGEGYVGLNWTVPMLAFTLLMAVGSDYNVLLVQRFDEERAKHKVREAMKRAMAASGGRISAAGLILAGSFSALLWGGAMDNMRQLGFALALGVLLDTFLVRPLLVPPMLLWKEPLLNGLKRALPSRWKASKLVPPPHFPERSASRSKRAKHGKKS